jgi:hypothetical protein
MRHLPVMINGLGGFTSKDFLVKNLGISLTDCLSPSADVVTDSMEPLRKSNWEIPLTLPIGLGLGTMDEVKSGLRMERLLTEGRSIAEMTARQWTRHLRRRMFENS